MQFHAHQALSEGTQEEISSRDASGTPRVSGQERPKSQSAAREEGSQNSIAVRGEKSDDCRVEQGEALCYNTTAATNDYKCRRHAQIHSSTTSSCWCFA